MARLSAGVLGTSAALIGTWLAASGRHLGASGSKAVAALWVTGGLASLLLRWQGFGGRDPDRWRRGSIGEEMTASELHRLERRGWSVRHDLRIPGSRANIDHVVAGRTGLWVVDTKATRAPVTAGWRRVYFGERRLDTASLRWEAEVLADRLEAVLGWSAAHALRPVVAVHGDGLRRRGGRAGGVPVVPGDRLVRRLRRGRRRLTREELREVADALDVAFPPAGATAGGRRSGVGFR